MGCSRLSMWKGIVMKRLLNFIIVLLVISVTSLAQPGFGQGPGGPPMKRIHAAKMAYITDRLRLSAEQSANFVPVYNDYERDLRSIRQSFFKKYKGNKEDMDDWAARQFIEDDLDYQQQVIELKRKYNDSFLKVISAQQLADLYKAEREFKQMLMQQLKQRRGGGKWK